MTTQKTIKLSDYYVKKGEVATQQQNGLMSSTDKTKLDGLSNYSHPNGFVAYSSGLYKITTDTNGHVISATLAEGSDLPSHSHNQYVQASDLSSKLDKNQGSGNSGKFLKVGSNGEVSPDTISIPNQYTHPGDHPTTFISNDQRYENIKSGELSSLTLTNQKLINDAINTKIGQLNSLVSSSVSISVVSAFDITDLETYTDENITDSLGMSFKNYCDDEAITLQANTIYLVPNDLTDIEFYYEFLVVDDGNDVFSEMIGTTQVDLSNYATISALNNKITSSITNGNTTQAPSSDAVYDALALKLNTADFATQLESVIDSLINEANQS